MRVGDSIAGLVKLVNHGFEAEEQPPAEFSGA
jgi:hypothetical protein